MKQIIYAFQYCPCINESGYLTVSLHLTKKGAEIAMEIHKGNKKKAFDKLYKKNNEDFGTNQWWFIRKFTIKN